MNLEYKSLLPEHFADNSRVWIYQSSRLFSLSEALQIEDLLENFVKGWNSHGTPVKGFATMFFGQFIILIADESAAGVSGCSTDSSVKLIREIERIFNVSMFDRQSLAFIKNEKVQLIPMNQLNYAVENGFINGNTLYFNNTVLDKKGLENEWLIQAKDSWLGKRFAFKINA